jgi:hypothetical protein
MRAASSGVFTLMAAWQAIEAAIRLRAASRFSACSGLPACSSTSTSICSNSGLHFKTIPFQFLRDPGKGDHLRRQQIDQHGHQQPLALDLRHSPLAQDPLEQNALVGYVLVDDPETLLVHSQDEGFAQLPQRPQRCKSMQGGAGAGFDAFFLRAPFRRGDTTWGRPVAAIRSPIHDLCYRVFRSGERKDPGGGHDGRWSQ